VEVEDPSPHGNSLTKLTVYSLFITRRIMPVLCLLARLNMKLTVLLLYYFYTNKKQATKFCRNFIKYWSILKLLSLSPSAVNLQ